MPSSSTKHLWTEVSSLISPLFYYLAQGESEVYLIVLGRDELPLQILIVKIDLFTSYNHTQGTDFHTLRVESSREIDLSCPGIAV